jgi:holin-like protein
MIKGLAVLLLFQLAGEALSWVTNWPVPGPVLGMLLLVIALKLWGTIPVWLKSVSHQILSVLTLFFVPVSLGIINYWNVFRDAGLELAIVLTVTTLGGLVLTAAIFAFLDKQPQDQPPHG